MPPESGAAPGYFDFEIVRPRNRRTCAVGGCLMGDVPPFEDGNILKKCSTIDAIWCILLVTFTNKNV
tara:strand:- start:1 stop:201 length:201 start_codon:yes stop_codon:yes gene_type:complete